jgi:hypothetical protein
VALAGAGDLGDHASLGDEDLPVAVVIFEDAGHRPAPTVMRRSGMRAVRVDEEPSLALAIAEALTSPAPSVITVGIPFE